MNGKTALACIAAAMASCIGAYGAPPGGGMGGAPGGTPGGGAGGTPGGAPGGCMGGSFAYDSFISVTTNANCLVREGVLFGYTSSMTTSVAPTAAAGVTALAQGVFAGNTSLKTVNLANTSISEVPSDCFAGCTALTSVVLPATCTAVGSGAFAGCSALASFTGSGVETVGRDAFRNCSSLASASASASGVGAYAYSQSGVTAADVSSVSELGEGAFAGCESLVSAAVAKNDVLPAALFAGCTALDVADWSSVAVFGQASLAGIPATSLTLSSAAEVGVYAFAANEATLATTLSTLPASYDADTSFFGREISLAGGVTEETVFEYEYDTDGDVVITGMEGAAGAIALPSSIGLRPVVAIADYAFFGETGITSIEIPASVTSIGVKAFKGCTALESVNFADLTSLETLGLASFQNCTGLTSVEIPESVTYVWSSTFEGMFFSGVRLAAF